MKLPAGVARLLAGMPSHGSLEQAFPLLSVDAMGLPHVCLLSRAQLEPLPSGVLALVGSPGTRANIARTGVATLIAVDEDGAHYCKLRRTHSLETPWALAAAFTLVGYKPDPSPVPLAPMAYVPDRGLEEAERWSQGVALLGQLREHL